ncbi:hypothetical protein GWI33_020654 [Rhynchophorus ferrugineus]|uniref:Uncharacterized protein n=1 Tax=Rhynchophorus ferrugineus TaxID=354439 RepID=A0A834HR35_RHYFE|nr:hypothetical protein GWI33_020654 [Rhynchophorus ferrugineus]
MSTEDDYCTPLISLHAYHSRSRLELHQKEQPVVPFMGWWHLFDGFCLSKLQKWLLLTVVLDVRIVMLEFSVNFIGNKAIAGMGLAT